MVLLVVTEFNATIAQILWIAGVAMVVSASLIVMSRRRATHTSTLAHRLAVTWLVAALAGLWYLTLTPIGEAASRPDSNLDLFANINARNIVGNIALFLPIGFFARLVWRSAQRPFLAATVFCVTVSFVVEIAQWAFGLGRSADIQDLALNALGGLAGAAVASVGVLIVAKTA